MSGQFANDIRAFAEATKRTIYGTLQAASVELATRFVMRSPVDTGKFRGNWRVSLGAIDTRTDAPEDKAPLGAPPSERLYGEWQDELQAVTHRSIIYVTNSLPYARVIEYGEYGNPPGTANGPKTVNGFSTQAPAGVVRVTVAEYQQIIRTAVAVAKSKAGK